MGGAKGRRKKYEPLLLDVPHISPPYCYRCPATDHDGCGERYAAELERAILELRRSGFDDDSIRRHVNELRQSVMASTAKAPYWAWVSPSSAQAFSNTAAEI